MTVMAAAGTRFYIGTSPMADKATDFVEADFSAVTWVEVDPIETIGVVGDETTEGTFDAINRRRTVVYKGQRRAPNLEVTAALNYEDAGQAKLLEAEASDENYPIRIVYNDTPASGSAPTPSERKAIGLVMSATEAIEGANDALRMRATIAINSNFVRKNAATGD